MPISYFKRGGIFFRSRSDLSASAKVTSTRCALLRQALPSTESTQRVDRQSLTSSYTSVCMIFLSNASLRSSFRTEWRESTILAERWLAMRADTNERYALSRFTSYS